MKYQRRITFRISTTLAAILLSSALLVSCGGSSGGADTTAGIGGTGIVYGRATAFGSVFVNGNRYDIGAGEIIVDDESGAGIGEDDLKLGMILRLEASTRNGNFTGTATRVVYDDEVEGPFAAVPTVDPMDSTVKIGNIFGQTIAFSDTTTIFENTSFENLGNEGGVAADVVEISGYRISDNEIKATYARYAGDLAFGSTKVELRGGISGYTGGATFVVDGTTINLVGTTLLYPRGLVIDNGVYVEVKGTIKSDLSVDADRVEAEDVDFGDDIDDISLQGAIAGFTNINADFFIDGQRVNAAGAQLSPAGLILMNGMIVEVEGEITGGTLFADEVEADDGDSELRSFVGSVNLAGGTFTVTYPTPVPGEVTVRVDGSTQFQDDTGAAVTPPFSLDDLNGGVNPDFVRVEGVEVANNEVLATFVRRRASPDNSRKLEGRVDNFVLHSSITVLGVTYGLDLVTTRYDPTPPDIDTGDFVEIEDERTGGANPPGIADEVEEE